MQSARVCGENGFHRTDLRKASNCGRRGQSTRQTSPTGASQIKDEGQLCPCCCRGRLGCWCVCCQRRRACPLSHRVFSDYRSVPAMGVAEHTSGLLWVRMLFVQLSAGVRWSCLPAMTRASCGCSGLVASFLSTTSLWRAHCHSTQASATADAPQRTSVAFATERSYPDDCSALDAGVHSLSSAPGNAFRACDGTMAVYVQR